MREAYTINCHANLIYATHNNKTEFCPHINLEIKTDLESTSIESKIQLESILVFNCMDCHDFANAESHNDGVADSEAKSG